MIIDIIDIIKKILAQYGLGITILLIYCFYLRIYYDAKPNTQINVLRGLIKITKRDDKVIISRIIITAIIISICFLLYLYTPPTHVPNCPYQISADEGTIRRLIEVEAEAVNSNEISIIQNIFATDAIIEDVANNIRWTDPIAHYQNIFREISYNGAINYSIRQIRRDGDEAIYTSASKGEYTNNITHVLNVYNNPPGSNEWVFKKDSDGCWKIIRFRFNIPQQ